MLPVVRSGYPRQPGLHLGDGTVPHVASVLAKLGLRDQARSNQANDEALSSLRGMPERDYSGPDEVSEVIAED